MPSHNGLVPLGTARNPLGTAASQTHVVLGLFFNKALLNDTRSVWHTRAVGMVPVSDAPRRWSDCTVPPLADADSCDSRRRLHPPVASPVAAGTRVYARLETLNFRALGNFRNFFDRVSPKPRRRLSARSDARSCDRRLLHACTRPFRAIPCQHYQLRPQVTRKGYRLPDPWSLRSSRCATAPHRRRIRRRIRPDQPQPNPPSPNFD